MLSFTTLFLLALGLFSVFSQSASAISHQGTRRRHHARLAANQRSATSPSLSVLAPTATSTAITSANPVVTTNVLTTRSTLSAGRTHLGCYSDNILRVIVGSYSYASWLNADACLDVCASQGFSIGGVECEYRRVIWLALALEGREMVPRYALSQEGSLPSPCGNLVRSVRQETRSTDCVDKPPPLGSLSLPDLGRSFAVASTVSSRLIPVHPKTSADVHRRSRPLSCIFSYQTVVNAS